MTRRDQTAEDHETLLDEIEAEFRDTAAWTGRPRMSPRVRAAMAAVPRHAFVPEDEQRLAYVNIPLAIGFGQTISQPYIVAIMTELLDIEPDHVVLEVGTGCGYQAAVLAELAAKVYSVEVVGELAEGARERLRSLGYDNAEIRSGDGYHGWPEHAPYDAIMVTAAAPEVPRALLEQLRPGGRMVLPRGEAWTTQDLVLVEKDRDGGVREQALLPVAFVPLTRKGRAEN